MVYRGGLENRFGLTADGGSNPSLSAIEEWIDGLVERAIGELNGLVEMKDLVVIGIWAAVIGTIFVVLWRKGVLRQMTDYVQQTREELRKCTWPTWDELKGSTVIVGISIFILGGFTVVVDQILVKVFVLFKL